MRAALLGASALMLVAAAAPAQQSSIDPEFYRLQAMAAQGDAEAQYRLGLRFDRGGFIAPDYVEALKWYRLAAAQEHREAIFTVGLMYLRGEGIRQNYREADAWFARAQALGHPGAQAIRQQIEPLIPTPSPPPPPPPAPPPKPQPVQFDTALLKQMQIDLKVLGHDPGAIDGVVGVKTRAAILAFETKQKMPRTGQPSEALLKALIVAKGAPKAG
jgi:hypothetical protein